MGLSLLVVGCLSNDPQVRMITTVALACDSYASTLTVLAKRRAAGKLSPKQVRKVNSVRVIANKPCLPGAAPPSDANLVRQLADGVADLIDIKRNTQ